MSVRVMTVAWSIDLPDSQKIVLLALADCANDEGHCWPSMASLAKKCSKSERTVQGAMNALEEAGHITRAQRPGRGCEYWVHPRSDCAPQGLPPAEAAPRSERHEPPQGLRDTPAAAADKPSKNHQEPSDSRSSDDEVRADHVFDHWNAKAEAWGKAKVRDRTPERRKLINARIAQHHLDGWREVFANFERSTFLQNAKGCHFDWLIKKNNFVKVLEGNYND